MGGPLSVIFSDIFMTKLEDDVVRPLKPIFYKRCVDNTFNRRKKNNPDHLFNAINEYHKRIKYAIGQNPTNFLDTKLIRNENSYSTEVVNKETKLPPHWTSKTPKRYKRNAINGNLYRAQQILSNFEAEIDKVYKKYSNAGYPSNFIKHVIKSFHENQQTKEAEREMLIPPELLQEKKPTVMIKLPFCFRNEKVSKTFISKLYDYAQNKFDFRIKWVTKKVKSLFQLKDGNRYPSCVIYKGVCSCGDGYVGETSRNFTTRWGEHEDIKHDSEPAKHLYENIDHKFTWSIISTAPKLFKNRKFFGARFTAFLKPKLNNKIKSKTLSLLETV